MEPFEQMLTGGHPNSLGRTIEVVDLVLANHSRFEELYNCYRSSDEVVRLRVSNAVKRLWRANPDLIAPHIDRFLTEISQINQASTQWTLATMFDELDTYLTPEQRAAALTLMQHNLATHNDWIVLNNTIDTLGKWAKAGDDDLKAWLKPHLARLRGETRKSVARRADRLYTALYEG
jgi:transcription elongation factor GreA-like protein